ncbi:MAG: STAS domain-containing protein [Actinomycetota bacterium]
MDNLSDIFSISREVAADGREIRLRVVGEIDMATAPRIDEALWSALDEGYERIAIDLSGVEFMDSAGLNALISARNAADARGVTLVIAELSDRARRLFEVSGLMTVFTFASS